MQHRGNLFVVSAPSGAGKTSLCKAVIDILPNLRHSVSHTTRSPRTGEVDGQDYHFVSNAQFDAMVADGAFVEWALVHGNRYGTAVASLEQVRDAGCDLLLEIDCQGAAQLKERCPDAIFIFILPPSLQELESRLKGRQTDTPEVIAQRLLNARDEMREMFWYDYLVINDEFDLASQQLQAILLASGCRTEVLKAQVQVLFEELDL
ncbi:guanylate kinase [Syntrophotalea acetylenivorans]|uniref:Guanylate kinase n=1 Tax=Syntrophotalea acetylenivorans TaxID=1842532 RepID=A0A1L3GL54_9BACT|nr:guanylate kinase [Syntrophotalea acetylenivorans]APG26673.1 guanylate kinase [Syntrophotalea acetylenivorans]